VISIHVSGYFTKMDSINALTLVYMIIDVVSHFAVPAFIFISGFVLYNKYNSNFDLKQFYLNRYKTIIPPYLIFSTFYIVVKLPVAKMLHRTIDMDILHMYLTGNALYHMWFFMLIIQLYILYPLILKIYNYSNNKSLALSFILSVLLSEYEVTSYLFYFVLGMYLNTHYKNLSMHQKYIAIPIFLTGTIIKIYECMDMYFSYGLLMHIPQYIINTVTVVYFTIIFLVLLEISNLLSNSKKLNSIDNLGSYSFAIYLIHALFIYIFAIIFSKSGFDYNNILFYPVMFILTLGFSMISINIIQRMPGSIYVIGKIH